MTLNGAGLANVVMNGLPGNPTTDTQGGYTATVTIGWSGTVAGACGVCLHAGLASLRKRYQQPSAGLHGGGLPNGYDIRHGQIQRHGAGERGDERPARETPQRTRRVCIRPRSIAAGPAR